MVRAACSEAVGVKQHGVYLHAEHLGQQLLHHLFRRRFDEVIGLHGFLLLSLLVRMTGTQVERQVSFPRQYLRRGRLEVVVEQLHLLNLTAGKPCHQLGSQVGRLLIVRFSAHVLIIAGRRQSLHLLHRIGHLTAHRINQDVLTAHLRLILCRTDCCWRQTPPRPLSSLHVSLQKAIPRSAPRPGNY